MNLSIIIVNYRDKAKLINCLDSINQIEFLDTSYEIIVVDNDSGDDLSGLESKYSMVRLINSPKNNGMGAGNNLGIDSSSGDYILILNPDTIVKNNTITILLDYLSNHPEVGIVGPQLLYPNGSLQLSCAHFPPVYMPILRRTCLGRYFKTIKNNFSMFNFDHNSIIGVDWLMGSCLMFKRQLVLADKSIFSPRFDERYFMYFEDIDLCRQFQAKKLKIIYNPQAVVIHDHARQSAKYPWYLAIFLDKLARHHIASWIKYFIKWGINYKNNIYEKN